MKQKHNLTAIDAPIVPVQIANALAVCLQEFDSDEKLPISVRAPRLAFANALNLAAMYPEDATRLRAEFGTFVMTAEELERLDAGITSFSFTGNWIQSICDILEDLSSRAKPRGADVLQRTTLALLAGVQAAERHPEFAQEITKQSAATDSESQFLATRLVQWRLSNWSPAQPPFVEYMASFYQAGSTARRVMVGSAKDVWSITRALSCPWDLKIWSETGWNGGRRGVKHYPELIRQMVSDLAEGELAKFTELYRACVLKTIAPDGAIRPERASLRFFALRYGRDYAGIYCRGDQPRLIAHAAFDFCFWMGVISTQPIACKADTE